jgi:predicted MFS family arabinose efflux permease
VFAATVAGGATSENADRTYAIGLGGALLLVVTIMAILPYAAERMGVLGVFVCIASFAIFCAPLFFGFKRRAKVEEISLAVWRTDGAPGLLFSWAAFSMGTSAVYVFAERIGRDIHLTPTQIGWVLSSGVFVGLIGTATAAIAGRRINRRLALYAGLIGSSVACLLIGFAPSLVPYCSGIFLFWIFTMFLYCYMLGSAAILDGTGRLGTLGSGTERLGYATGAWAGGELAQHTSFPTIGVFGFAVCIAGVIVGFPSLCRALDRRLN